MAAVMDWSYLQHRIPYEKNFRWPGGQVSRVEALTDDKPKDAAIMAGDTTAARRLVAG